MDEVTEHNLKGFSCGCNGLVHIHCLLNYPAVLSQCPYCRVDFKKDVVEEFREQTRDEGYLITVETLSKWNGKNKDECVVEVTVTLPPQATNTLIRLHEVISPKTEVSKFPVITTAEYTTLPIYVRYKSAVGEFIEAFVCHTIINPYPQAKFVDIHHYVANVTFANNFAHIDEDFKPVYCASDCVRLVNKYTKTYLDAAKKTQNLYPYRMRMIGEFIGRPKQNLSKTLEEGKTSSRVTKKFSDFVEPTGLDGDC
jgi:hypothetical protein